MVIFLFTLGSKVTTTPKSSPTLCRMYLEERIDKSFTWTIWLSFGWKTWLIVFCQNFCMIYQGRPGWLGFAKTFFYEISGETWLIEFCQNFCMKYEGRPGHPEVISHINSLGRSDLELPLGRHNLGINLFANTFIFAASFFLSFYLSICARDPDAGIEAGPVVGLNNVPSVNLKQTKNVVLSIDLKNGPLNIVFLCA